MVQSQEGIVFEHPPREVRLRPRLDLDVNKDDLRLAIAGLKLRYDVGLPHLSCRDIGEDLLVVEPQGLEVEPRRHFGKEQLQETLEEWFENRFEELVVSHSAFLQGGRRSTGGKPALRQV
jgi:hypothetical protein